MAKITFAKDAVLDLGSSRRLFALNIEVDQKALKDSLNAMAANKAGRKQGVAFKSATQGDVDTAMKKMAIAISAKLAQSARDTMAGFLDPRNANYKIGYSGASMEAIKVASGNASDGLSYVYETVGGHNWTIRHGQQGYGGEEVNQPPRRSKYKYGLTKLPAATRSRIKQLRKSLSKFVDWGEARILSPRAETPRDLAQGVITNIAKYGTSVSYQQRSYTGGHRYFDYSKYYANNFANRMIQQFYDLYGEEVYPGLASIFFGYMASQYRQSSSNVTGQRYMANYGSRF